MKKQLIGLGISLSLLGGVGMANAGLIDMSSAEARQSTNLGDVYSQYSYANAGLAIDGNTDGDFFNNKSTSSTQLESNAFWTVDLGSSFALDDIVIWQRTDNTNFRFTDFTVSIWDDLGNKTWDSVDYSWSSGPDAFMTIDLMGDNSGNAVWGQTVTIQRSTTGYLQLAEVQLYSYEGEVVSNDLGDDGNSFESVGGTEPVPEPATMLLFGTGLVGLMGSRIRRKKK